MNEFDLMTPSKVAEKYGGDKRKIAQAAQMGIINPTVAVMAGMFIDRMRGAAVNEQASQTTVAQDVMAEPSGGVAALPVPDSMYGGEEGFAGGGIVAFDDGGSVQHFQNTGYVNPYSRYTGVADPRSNILQFTEEELEEQKRLKEAGLMDALGYMKRKFADPIADYFASDPARRAMMGEKTPTKAPVTPTVSEPYPDETTRGTARSILAGDLKAREFVPPKEEPAEPPKAKEEKATKAEESVEDALARRKRMLKEAGVSEDPFAEDRATAKTRAEEIAAKREENKAIAMIMGGLSGMSGRNLAEFAQKAGTAGFGQYLKGEKETREDQRELDKINRDLNKAEQAYKVGNVDKALEYEDKATQRAIQLRGVVAQEKAALKPSTFQEISAALRSPDPAVRKAAEQYLGVSKMGGISEKDIYTAWTKAQADPAQMIALKRQGITTFDQFKAAQLAAMGGGGSGAKFLGFE